ncbi:MAG: valine--tRNA ligase [Firmicutes bacterium]|nr:valine--tRNA ligase [Bacillota bacterium]
MEERRKGLAAEEVAEELPKAWNPAEGEPEAARIWEEAGLYRAPEGGRSRTGERFSIVMPPPNVTGNLHMGHAMDNTLQDILVRWHRMRGDATLWQPGTDHAGIATQHVVEVRLAEEGLDRRSLGREAFVERVWRWKDEYEANILRQLRRMGASPDWSRLRFTMDEGLSRAVREVFVRLWERGLIYRGDYIIQWCPDCGTALADIEVEHEPAEGRLYRVRYPLLDGEGRESGEALEVATARPETMFGDVAVAVHPGDGRYRHLVGRALRHPLVDRKLPVIADEAVDPDFGTGALKVTPAHDPDDFEIGRRHGLEPVQVIDEEGRLTAEAGRFAGMERFAAREAVVEELRRRGFLAGEERYEQAVGRCYRCGTVVEPLVSRQWFVRVGPLADKARRAVERGEVRFVPERFTRIFFNWLDGLHDWCISRQIWWGHRIPAWTCAHCGQLTVAREAPERCPRCGSTELEQDPDVLDTWFSSALWPFTTLGWPERTRELELYYPTSVLVTGYDILFFWVARMLFMGLEFMGQVPFRTVVLHGLIRDEQGRKMSKSRGNGVDPLEVADVYGADALRWSLVVGVSPGNDQRFLREKVEGARNFANKVWNVARFARLNLGDLKAGFDADGLPLLPEEGLRLEDRWILSRLGAVTEAVDRRLGQFEFGEAARELYDFLWGEVCDWYVEAIKPRLRPEAGDEAAEADRGVAQRVLLGLLDRSLRLLHPFMPFVSEVIWQHLPHRGPALMGAAWPAAEERRDAAAEEAMGRLMAAVRAMRNLRSELRLAPSARPRFLVRGEGAGLLLDEARMVRTLAGLGGLEPVQPGAEPEPGSFLADVAGGAELILPLEGLGDREELRARFARELERLEEELGRERARLASDGFVRKAPPEVVERSRRAVEEKEAAAALLRLRLRQLGAL